LVAVFFRYILHSPIFWTGEILRTAFIWVVFMGATLIHSQKNHIEIEIFYNLCPGIIQKILNVIVFILSTIFLVILVKESYILTVETATIKSAVLRYPMGLLNASVLFCSAICLIYQFLTLIYWISGQNSKVQD